MLRQSKHIGFETGAATHPGRVRQRNEDSYLSKPEIGIWAVADGMGGHEAGDVASAVVVEALASIVPPNSAFELFTQCENRIATANSRVRQIAEERGGIVMGTTVAALLIFDANYACVWSGDSRIYLVRDGQIAQVSRDHTQVQELLDEGAITAEEAKTWPGRNVITRAIGVYDDAELELKNGNLRPGDSFILCSDGLIAHVSDAEISDHISSGTAQLACDRLIDLTLERGAIDNVTVVNVRYMPQLLHGATQVRTITGRRDPWG